MTAQQLRRLEPARRHPLFLVLLHALVIERGDELLDLSDKLLRVTDGRARRRVAEQRRRTARQRDELAFLGRRLSVALLECATTGELPLERVQARRSPPPRPLPADPRQRRAGLERPAT